MRFFIVFLLTKTGAKVGFFFDMAKLFNNVGLHILIF